MSQAAKAQEPSMEEILASIRRIIADDENSRPAPVPVRETPRAFAATAAAVPNFVEPATPVVAATAKLAPSEAPALDSASPSVPIVAEAAPSVDAAGPSLSGVPSSQDLMAAFEPRREPAPAVDTPLFSDPPERAQAEPAEQPHFVPHDTAVLDAIAEAMRAPEPQAGARQASASYERYEPEAVAPAYEPQWPAAAGEGGLLSNHTSEAVNSAFNALQHTVFTQNAQTLDDVVRDMLRPMLKSWLDDNLPTVVERLVRAEIERVSRGR